MSDYPKILCFSGKKQAGKSSACNFVHCISLVMEPMRLTTKAYLNENGDIIVNNADGNDEIFDVRRRDPEYVDFASKYIWPYLRIISFADPLKEMCINLLGLSEEQVYGTDEQKNSLVPHLLWENFPLGAWVDSDGNTYVGTRKKKSDNPKFGPMSGRETMEYYGTEIFRKHYPQVHAKACVKSMLKSSVAIGCLNDDLRFPDEVDEVHAVNGKVVRFTRGEDGSHQSNTALDPDKYDWNNFDAVIDNKDLTMEETHEEVFRLLIEWKWIEINE